MTNDQLLALGLTILFVVLGLAVIPYDKWLTTRKTRRDARRRNQARPWR